MNFRKNLGILLVIVLLISSFVPVNAEGADSYLTILDPAHLVYPTTILGKDISTVIGDLEEGQQYIRKENLFSEPGFEQYSFVSHYMYPNFDYLEIPSGQLYLDIQSNYETGLISLIQYHFAETEENTDRFIQAVTLIEKILALCCGDYTDCSILSGYDMQSSDIDTINSLIQSRQPGSYMAQWKNKQYVISLNVHVEDTDYCYNGTVAFTTNQDPSDVPDYSNPVSAEAIQYYLENTITPAFTCFNPDRIIDYKMTLENETDTVYSLYVTEDQKEYFYTVSFSKNGDYVERYSIMFGDECWMEEVPMAHLVDLIYYHIYLLGFEGDEAYEHLLDFGECIYKYPNNNEYTTHNLSNDTSQITLAYSGEYKSIQFAVFP